MTSAAQLSNDELAQLCAIETEKFNRRQSSDAQFCFELFRRALADDATEAFTLVYRVYERQVQHWVMRHPQFAYTHEAPEYFASRAWFSFFTALRGPKFAGFSSLPHILGYLKQCTFTAVAISLREQQRGTTISLEAQVGAAHTPNLTAQIDAEQVVQRIAALLPKAHDQLLARCALVEQLKPREIAQAYPEHWPDVRAVTVDLYRIRRLLRQDAELRELWGLTDTA